MPYLLDADWSIQSLHQHGQAAITLRRLAPQRIAVSIITLVELYEASFMTTNPKAHMAGLRNFLAPFRLLNLNEDIAQRAAEIRAHLRRQGRIISDFDILIGATALHYGLTVLTFNRRHFERIPDLKLYTTT